MNKFIITLLLVPFLASCQVFKPVVAVKVPEQSFYVGEMPEVPPPNSSDNEKAIFIYKMEIYAQSCTVQLEELRAFLEGQGVEILSVKPEGVSD